MVRIEVLGSVNPNLNPNPIYNPTFVVPYFCSSVDVGTVSECSNEH